MLWHLPQVRNFSSNRHKRPKRRRLRKLAWFDDAPCRSDIGVTECRHKNDSNVLSKTHLQQTDTRSTVNALKRQTHRKVGTQSHRSNGLA